jgi:PKD repeat protein
MVLIAPDKTILEQDFSSSAYISTVTGHGGVAQPCQEILTADFTINPVTVVFGNSIVFNDESLGDPISWQWTFDGGIPATSTDTIVSVQYNTVGIYPVTLTVSDGVDTHTKTDYVYVVLPSAPVPDFVATQTTIMVGETISFLDLTTGNPTSWNWTFQGGSPITSIEQHPTAVTYNYPGEYHVFLNTTNPWGVSHATKYDYIKVVAQDPVVEVCDTISNLLPLDSLMVYEVLPWGVIPGHNALGYTAYADKYTNADSVYDKVNGLLAWVKVANASAGLKVKFSVWSGTTQPTTVLGFKEVLISSLTSNFANYIFFDAPIDVQGTFWVGYELTYNAQSVFSCSMSDNRGPTGSSTMYVKANNSWVAVQNIPLLNNYHGSLGVEPIVCNTTGAVFGVDEFSALTPFDLYPNPSQGQFTIRFDDGLLHAENIQVYDITGKTLDFSRLNQGSNQVEIRLSHPLNGMYFVRVQTKDGIYTRKIVLTR